MPKTEVRDRLAKMYNVKDAQNVVVFGFQTQYGGGRSSGFGLIYESLEAQKKFEPKHRLKRIGAGPAKGLNRKQRKERKRRGLRNRGAKKWEAKEKK